MSTRYSRSIRLVLDGLRITVGVTRENTITMTPDPGVLTPDEAHRLAVALVNCAEHARDQLRAAAQDDGPQYCEAPDPDSGLLCILFRGHGGRHYSPRMDSEIGAHWDNKADGSQP